MKMYADIKFDRVIDPELHYICPGGYEVRIDNKNIQFDFNSYEGNIDKDDQTILHLSMYDLDCDSFPEAAVLEAVLGPMEKILEFFVYTGEYDEPEIKPVSLLAFKLYKSSGEEILIPDTLLGEIWKEEDK